MRNMFKLLLGLAMLSLLAWRLNVHMIVDAIAHYRLPYILTAAVLLLVSFVIAALRWKVFVPRFALRALLELTLIGQFYSVVLPGQIAGELVKAYRLAKGNSDTERLAASVFVDRVIGLISMLMIAGVGIALSPHHLPSALSAVVGLLIAFLLIGLLALRFRALHSFVLLVVRRIERTPLRRFAPPVERTLQAWREFSGMPGRLFSSLALGIVFQCIGIAIYAVLGANLGIVLALADWAWIVAIASIAVLLPLSVGGLGLREGALIGCLTYLGIASESAVALSLGVFAIMLLGALLGGTVELALATKRRPVV